MPRARLCRRSKHHLLPLKFNHTGIGGQHAADNLHERRLASAIVANETDNLALGNRERHVFERDDRAEVLVDPSSPQNRLRRGFGGVGHRQTCVIARRAAPLDSINARPGNTISPAMSLCLPTWFKQALKFSADIGGPQSAASFGSRFESACTTGSVFTPVVSDTFLKADPTQAGGCKRILWYSIGAIQSARGVRSRIR